MDIFKAYSEGYSRLAEEEISLQDCLQGCRGNPTLYASAAERMVAAIGKPETTDTSKDTRLGRHLSESHHQALPRLIANFMACRKRSSRSSAIFAMLPKA